MNKIKFFIIWALLAFMPLNAFAVTSYCDTEMCASVPENINGPISSTLSKISGMNFLLSTILESQVKKQMDEDLTADFKVDITPFGARSLMQGKFKKFSAHADSAYIDGFYVSNVNAESLCDYNHFIYKDGEVYTNENFLMSFSVDVTSADLQKILNTPEYMKLLNSMNVSVAGVSMFKIFDPKASIEGNRLLFSMKVISPLTLGEPKLVSSSMSLYVEDGKILFTDLQLPHSLTSLNVDALLPIINKLNPFVFKSNLLHNSKGIIKIKDVNFVDNKIVVKGLVIVPKNYYNN